MKELLKAVDKIKWQGMGELGPTRYTQAMLDIAHAITDPTPVDAEWLESMGWKVNGDVYWEQASPSLQLEFGENSKWLFLSRESDTLDDITPLATNPTRGQVAALMLALGEATSD